MAQISVLISVYNVSQYVERALESVQQQTERDLQIVVVNDCSTDDTLRVVMGRAADDARIKVVSTSRNLGIPGALNYGLPYCTAPFIAKMDGDDIALPRRLEEQLAFLNAHPDVALVGCQIIACDIEDRPLSPPSRLPISQEEIARTLMLNNPCPHTWLARRELYERLQGYREISVAEDYEFLLRACTEGFKLANLNQALMLVRLRPGNTTDAKSLQQMKAHYYARRLYRERRTKGQDSFSPAETARALASNRLERAAHRLARGWVRRAFATHSHAGRYLCFLLAALASPWQARYFLDRARFRLELRQCQRAAAKARPAVAANAELER